jgi:hypothetical protein
MVRQFMDRFEYVRIDNVNRLTMIKRCDTDNTDP